MRRKSDSSLFFDFDDAGLPKVVVEFRNKYRAVHRSLKATPEILDLAHEDFKALSQSRGGRSGDYTSETILRTLVVHFLEGKSLRETILMIAESRFLQEFTLSYKKEVMDYSFLDRCLKALQPQTVEAIHLALAKGAIQSGLLNPDVLRLDTTVVESNVHFPTDSSLLWDTYRVIARLLSKARELSQKTVPWRFHTKKIKALHLYITRYSKSSSPRRRRRVRTKIKVLIQRVKGAIERAGQFCANQMNSGREDIAQIAEELAGYLPAMEQAAWVAERLYIFREEVPSHERVYSIFEPHTELIMRGRRNKPVEFGHKVFLAQTEEKFILDFSVMKEKRPDNSLTREYIEKHKRIFGKAPKVIAADKGFCPSAEEYQELEKMVDTLAIPKRMRDLVDAVLKGWQFFRAGIEGTISGLKRAFRLSRCMYRGFKTFRVAVGMGVIAHNLLLFGKLLV